MAKKCLPGVICIESMTLFVLCLLFVLAIYIYYVHFYKQQPIIHNHDIQTGPTVVTPPSFINIGTRTNPLNDPYMPPLRNDGYYFPRDSLDVRGVPGIPINIQTRGTGMDYSQLGILTRQNVTNTRLRDEEILPLMGRKLMNGRDTWQYYTMSTTGNMNTKLPVTVNGKSGSGEYGCYEIQNGDTIYVKGYNDTFTATVYENGTFSYIPYI
jgi:hypothetical protein